MNEKIEKALVRVEEYVTLAHEWLDDEEFKEDLAAVNLIKAALEDYEKVKAEVESLTEALDIAAKAYATLKARAEKAEAALRSQAGNHSIDLIRLEQAEAELDSERAAHNLTLQQVANLDRQIDKLEAEQRVVYLLRKYGEAPEAPLD